ncbi:hypothetical protein AGMMS49525_00700 [Bacteroidia bacterium]|nr:hypothetical protein AGMMS49525_00700 [Bacteroidia bacterium]
MNAFRSNGVPTFRALVAADIPVLNQNTTGTAAKATMLASGTDSTKLAGIAAGATKNDLATAVPLIAGTASIGTTASGYAAGDHVHPTQVQNNLTTASTTLAPSVTAVRDSLAIKLNQTATLAFTGDITASATQIGSGTIATTLANTAVTPAAYGQTAAQSPDWGSTFSVPSFTVDATSLDGCGCT